MMWPTICVDDFFNDPDKVVEISKDLKFESRQFYPGTINIKGIYNRLVLFDGASHHAAHINNTGEDRLTLICFFEKLTLNSSNKQLKYMIPTSRKI